MPNQKLLFVQILSLNFYKLDLGAISKEEISIYNFLGKEVLKANTKQINISALSSGVYFVKVEDVVTKFVKE